MFGIHPIRWARRTVRTTTRKVITTLVILSSAGSGTAVMAPDSVPGRIGEVLVSMVHQALVNQHETPTQP